MRELSGGFRLRALLAQTLFAEPELLLLDEPTNHLDIASIAWLESYLRAFSGTFVVVSHDRHFLNAIADTIADVDYGELRLYTGDYDAFEAAKVLAVVQKESEIARTEARVEELQRFIDRFRAKATKARQASARKKQVERIELPEVTRSSRRAPGFRFQSKRRPGREVLRVRDLARGYGGVPVLAGLGFTVERGERVAVVGPNGVGKSTLLKNRRGGARARRGERRAGHEVHPGYFAQDHRELLVGDQSALSWLSALDAEGDVRAVRGALGAVLLGGDESEKRVSDLSGGEAARLLLAGLMLRRPNLLILDEPTNHLDLEAREALMHALREYDGTLLVVSHDRHFVSAVGTRVLAISAGGVVEDFAGDYEEYLERRGEDYLAAAVLGASRAAPPAAHRAGAPAAPLSASASGWLRGSRAPSRSTSARSPGSRGRSRCWRRASPRPATTSARRASAWRRTRGAGASCARASRHGSPSGSAPPPSWRRCSRPRSPRSRGHGRWGQVARSCPGWTRPCPRGGRGRRTSW